VLSLSSSSYFPAMSKNDMKDRICTLSKNDLKDLVKIYRIPLDLHPRLTDPEFTMDRLPTDAIGIYSKEEVLVRSGLSSMWFNKECDMVFRRVDDNDEMSIYDFMTLPSWSDARIFEESHHLTLPLLERVSSHTTASATEGAFIPLPTPDEIVASLLDSRFVKNSKGPSHASRPSKKRKLQKRDLEAGSSAPELDQAKGTDEADLADLCAEIKDSLERDEGVSMWAVSVPTPCLGKRLGAPPSIVVVSASEPSHVGTSAPASTSGRSLSLGGMLLFLPLFFYPSLCFWLGCLWIFKCRCYYVGKSGAEVMRRQMDPLDCLAHSALARDAEYDQIPDDDFGTATRGEEIDLTLFPLAPGPYHIPYPYEGVSSPLYTREEWNRPPCTKT
ncbi:hypothetical protein Tco_1333067, partial [Tanacetum coccineum]